MKTISLFLILFFLLANAGCKKSHLDQESNPLSGKWTLMSIQNVQNSQVTNYPDSIPKKMYITFTDSASVLTFTGICNTGWGTFSIQSTDINISTILSSKVNCPNIIWEGYLLDNLPSAYMYNLYGDLLVIRTHGTYNLLLMKKP